LIRTKVSSLPTDDLVVVDSAHRQLHILSDLEPNQSEIRNPKSEILSADGAPVAVLPMRLNTDALSDLVILREGSSAPTVMMTAAAMTFTVNDTGNGRDATPGDGVCATTTAVCTLRAAIQEANANVGADTINFSIGSGTKTISPTSALPTITDPVTIDGTTQPGFAGSPIIELNGASAFGADGLKITAGNSTVRGLVINRCSVADGIEIGTNGNNIIEGNFIGTNVAGTAALGNSQRGVRIVSGPNNTVGGTTAAARNVISGNKEVGVDTSSAGNQVQGNYIGTDVTGMTDLGNAMDGIAIGSSPTTSSAGPIRRLGTSSQAMMMEWI
jgi:CSLREA domain-containing protein